VQSLPNDVEVTVDRTTIKTSSAPAALGPYSQAIKSGDLLFCSGQLGLDPATGALVDGGVEAQAEQAMRNLAAVLEAGGSSFARVLKTVIFLADMNDFAAVNAVYGRAFEGIEPPARSTVQVAALPKAGLVEIEMIARCD
jgi:2-iminobutanoate/2-iminopropanoate deaminase